MYDWIMKQCQINLVHHQVMMFGGCSLSCNLYVALYPIINDKAYLKYENVNKI
jgi:hypothetical protein